MKKKTKTIQFLIIFNEKIENRISNLFICLFVRKEQALVSATKQSLPDQIKSDNVYFFRFLFLNSQNRKQVVLGFNFPVSEWQLRNPSNPLASKSTDLNSSHF